MGKALWATATKAIRLIARIQGADKAAVTVGVDCDGVTIRAGGVLVILDRAAREEFVRAFFEADAQAEAWAERYGGSDG